MKCRLVIPSFQDERRLAAFLPRLASALLSEPGLQVVVVDDGSGQREADATRKLVERVSENVTSKIRFLALPNNLGKGGAIYSGWSEPGDFDWLGFADADGAISAEEVERMLFRIRQIESGGDPVDGLLASRVKMLGRRVTRNSLRHLIGRVFATLATLMTGVAIYDSQCGCKFFRRTCYEAVKPRLTEMRFGFDMELLFHLLARGFHLEEFPVDWTDVPGSKVSIPRDSWQMFGTLLKLRQAKARARGE